MISKYKKKKRNYNNMKKANNNLIDNSLNNNEEEDIDILKTLSLPKLNYSHNLNKDLLINNINYKNNNINGTNFYRKIDDYLINIYITKINNFKIKIILNTSKNYIATENLFKVNDSVLIFNNFTSHFIKNKQCYYLEKSKIKKKILYLIYVEL